MLCPDCNTYAADDEIVCRRCGKLLNREITEEEELMSFRQGRHLRHVQDELPPPPKAPGSTGASRSFEDTRPLQTAESTGAVYSRRETLAGTGRFYGLDEEAENNMPMSYGVSSTPVIMAERRRSSRVKRGMARQRMINWAYVMVGCIVLLIALAVGAYMFLKNTLTGQVIMARMGMDATSAAMWQVGEENMRKGDIQTAIEYFCIAREKDIEAEEDNVSGLLQLGTAYEANDQLAEAEEVYAYVYTEVVPSAPEAYRNQVRVLLAQDRKAEAAVLLKTAYTLTGVTSFDDQRDEILPEVPTVSVQSDYYNAEQNVELLQGQDFEIWYSLDPYAELPAEGILYEAPIALGQGEHKLRAVAVDGDLVSDMMTASYSIYLPTPLQPDATLAPATYKTKRTVSLKPGTLSEEDLEKNPGYAATLDDPLAQDITIYYTIDGSDPDLDSPIFDGTPIQLPTGGYVTLKAVSVNGYQKQGNMKTVLYKIDCGPYYKKVFSTADVIADLKLGTTTREAFRTKYGDGEGPEMVMHSTVEELCEKYVYDWGYVTFMKTKVGWVLADIYFTNDQFKGPRDTKIGMKETDVTGLFKDFGQVVGATGVKRGLYYVSEDEQGVISIMPSGEKTIYYRTDTADGHVWQLEYQLNSSGVVTSIRWFYEP